MCVWIKPKIIKLQSYPQHWPNLYKTFIICWIIKKIYQYRNYNKKLKGRIKIFLHIWSAQTKWNKVSVWFFSMFHPQNTHKAQHTDALFYPVNHCNLSRPSTWDNLCSCQPWATGALRGKVSTVASAHIFFQQQFMRARRVNRSDPEGCSLS